MGQALYRKHRPEKLSEIVGQEHITRTLENAIKAGQISHAYLFTGPKGVGKTSIARILAYEVNGLPYDTSGSHLDIIEIDAASNRRIDEIRELRQRATLAPTSAKYKVYIIDEVHMLTKEAFNALLKTLEEPPAHVIFILATTEAYKLPETITSRTQQFKFRPIPIKQVVEQLQKIAKSEKIVADTDALTMIAVDGNGSFRDSISLLDQLSSTGANITKSDVEQQLGMAPNEVVLKLLDAIKQFNLKELQSLFLEIQSSGYSYSMLAKQLVSKLRQDLLDGHNQLDGEKVLKLMNLLINVSTFQDQTSAFELAILSVAINEVNASTNIPVEIAPIVKQPEIIKDQPKQPSPPAPKDEQTLKKREEEPKAVTAKKELIDYDDKTWTSLLEVIRNQYNTLYSVAKMTEPELLDGVLRMKTKYPFHQRKLSEDKTKRLFEDIIYDLTNKKIKIEVIVDENVGLKQASETPEEVVPVSMDTISNIFGNAEVVE